jgi:hypothetical protein
MSKTSGSSDLKLSVIAYRTMEDTELKADLQADGHTLNELMQIASTLSITAQPSHGKLTFDIANATFSYMPDKDFYGEDGFEISELPDGDKVSIKRQVSIMVQSENDLPYIRTDNLNYRMNSLSNPALIEAFDLENGLAEVLLNEADARVVMTKNGKLEKINGQIFYTPNQLYRGIENHEFVARDSNGGIGKKTIAINVENIFNDVQPALAVRASACITCHANVRSQYITDFGYGNAWFMGLNSLPGISPTSGNLYGDHGGSWATAKISGPVIVPKTNSVTFGGMTGTLKAYITREENKKATPATVIEKDTVYIGAPNVATLQSRFFVSASDELKYSPNDQSSPALSGLVKDSAGYYTNNAELVCDGDLYVKGTLMLDTPKVKTKNGCRIYATGPIFLRKNVSYVNLGSATAANNTNLQLISSRAVVLGVGATACNDSWYSANAPTIGPLAERFKYIWTVPSHITRDTEGRTTQQENELILNEGLKLKGFEDASCYAEGRAIHLNRILIAAPSVQSRLTGNVSGVVIAEVPLFALGQFSYEFDSVFQRVPVLPILKSTDFLDIR